MIFHNGYKNRRVLVTGHTDVKGSWLAIWLKELGAEVVGYALEPLSDPNNFAATGMPPRVMTGMPYDTIWKSSICGQI